MKPVLRRSKSLKYSVNLTFLALTTCRILSSISLRDVELVKLYRQQRNSMTYVWYPSIISIQTCKGQFSNMKLLNDNMTLWLSYITLWTVSLDSAQISLNITESTVWIYPHKHLYPSLVLPVVPFFIIWLAPRAGNMNQISYCDWLPERARWSHLACSGLPAVSHKQNSPKAI